MDIYNLSPFYFYKVIEVLIRAEEGLSRDVVKHLNHVGVRVFVSYHIHSQLVHNFVQMREDAIYVSNCRLKKRSSKVTFGNPILLYGRQLIKRKETFLSVKTLLCHINLKKKKLPTGDLHKS